MSENCPSPDLSCYHDAYSSPSALNPPRLSSNNLPRKRKRSEDPDQHRNSNVPAFRIQSPVASSENASVEVTPLFTIPRAALPLSCLDLTPPDTSGTTPSRLFSANVSALETEFSQSTSADPVVLIARISDQKHAFAIERILKGTFALCRLHPSAGLEGLCRQTEPSLKKKRVLDQGRTQPGIHGHDWWASAVLDPAGVLTESSPTPKETAKPTSAPAERLESTWQTSPLLNNAEQIQPPQSLPETHLSIVQQYLETLYLSKSSLAFFAKGPLSRARAAHVSHDKENGASVELAEYLRLMILPASATDTKYRSSITEILKSSSEVWPMKWPVKPRKRAMKPGKDGLYKPESQHIRQWWNNHCDNGASGEKNLNEALRALRFRESCLQIIMVLEILSLESSLANDSRTGEAASKGVINESESQQNEPMKKKKPQDLNLTLELLLDRLCIWQSIELDSDVGSKNLGLDEQQDLKGASEGDRLREFCLEVIIPLYNNRLPSVVKDISKRIGVSIRPSPRSDKREYNPKYEKKVAPGTKIQRKPPPKVQEQPRSNERNAKIKKPAPPLSRSTSDNMSKLTKSGRDVESQEPLLETRHRRSMSRASSMMTSKKLSRREVDMSAITRFNESKTKKKAVVEQELHDAIATLKKPNREQAVKDYVEAAEKRGTVGNAQPNKPNKLGLAAKRRLNVQVDATPIRKEKTRREGEFAVPAQPAVLEASPASQPMIPSTNPCVPSSSKRPTDSKAMSQPNFGTPSFSDTSFQKSRFRDVYQTPSRPADKKKSFLAPPGRLDSGDDGTVITCSATKQIAHDAFAQPSQQRPEHDSASDEDELQAGMGVSSTPLMLKDKTHSREKGIIVRESGDAKRRSTKEVIQRKPDHFEEAGDQSIYDVLGWGDDMDL